jgi:ankyrin repeat protein
MIENENINFDSMFPNKEDIEKYIEQNNPLDIQDNYDDTLLMYVCFKEYDDVALKMLGYGPKAVHLSFQNEENNNLTALSVACFLRLKNVVMKMLEYGPKETNINSQDVSGDTPLMLLLREVSEDNDLLVPIFKILDFEPRGLNLALVNDEGYTVLMLACEYQLREVALKMLENPAFNLNLFQEKDGETAYDIAYRNSLVDVSHLLRERMREEEAYQIEIPLTNTNTKVELEVQNYNVGTMPVIPKEKVEKYNKINVNGDGWEPFQMENINILQYLADDKEDNIAIRFLDKIYLTKRSIVKQQRMEATVFECLEGNKKIPSNIVKNLPLYNIKKIGINISSDNAVGLEPEYIYMDGIEPILQNTDSSENMFAIIPLDKILVSVISLEELEKIGTEFSGASALHCQAGQAGLAGIIVSALSINSGGKTLKKRHKWNKKKTLKKKKKSFKKKSKKSFKKNKNKRTQFRKK